ncbi:TPA: phosphomannomutase [Morganella morganii]
MLNTTDIFEKSSVKFGTSGVRGLVTNFTTEVCSAFMHSFIYSMKSKFSFNQIAIAIDNRPSSEFIASSCIDAIKQQGLEPIYYGVLPTPALAYASMINGIPCIMVTGSHIPFDRNGLKFYRPDGEITKIDEQAILNCHIQFELPENLQSPLLVSSLAAKKYIQRYTSVFDKELLLGKRIGIYEHSSAGRDIYSVLFQKLGAEVISLERSDEFVPIDTEAVAEEDKIKAKKWSELYQLDAIFSTDGDGDRPLVADENGDWLRGDILGLLCALEMDIEALAIPISCNTIIAAHNHFECVEQTKIGSPYVIDKLATLAQSYSKVAGFEANGGFILGSDIKVNGKYLSSLPTRDAVLPFLMLLSAAKQTGIAHLVKNLPRRITFSDRIQNFATEKSKYILGKAQEKPLKLLQALGFADVKLLDLNTVDGLRMLLSDGNIIHLRPSGNAPELRCYAEADSSEAAKSIVLQVLNKIKTLSDF